MNSNTDVAALSNLAIIRGVIANEPLARELPAGGLVVQFDVTTRITCDGRESNVSVPVAWRDPTTTQLRVVVPGAELVVVGTVRRRFFRVGGATQSRTEVVAEQVIPSRRHKGVVAALRDAADRLLDLAA